MLDTNSSLWGESCVCVCVFLHSLVIHFRTALEDVVVYATSSQKSSTDS